MMARSPIFNSLAIACILFLTSCTFTGDGVIDLTINIEVAPDVNPDENDRPSPIFLQVIELRDASSFANADYLSLYQDARAELGGTYLHSTEIGPLFPGSTRTEELRLNTVTGAVGLLGEFNRYIDVKTSDHLALTPGKDRKIKVRIDRSGVYLN